VFRTSKPLTCTPYCREVRDLRKPYVESHATSCVVKWEIWGNLMLSHMQHHVLWSERSEEIYLESHATSRVVWHFCSASWEMIVRFVDIGEIVDHHCLNFLFLSLIIIHKFNFVVNILYKWLLSRWFYFRNLREYNKFAKIKTDGNTFILNVQFFLHEHNSKNKNWWISLIFILANFTTYAVYNKKLCLLMSLPFLAIDYFSWSLYHLPSPILV
jgi:hypothetical protein